MSTTRKSLIFLALTFAISWSIAIGGWAMGAANTPGTAVLALFGMMTGPAIAAFLCAMTLEKNGRAEALGLRFKPNWWWLIAYLIPLALSAASLAFTLLFSDRTLADLKANLLLAAQQAGQDTSQMQSLPLVPIVLVQALLVGAAINAFLLTITEELGWRGYLHGLWRPAGFWRASLGTGLVWGVWHAPAIYLLGHNYPDNRVLGVAIFTLFCILLSPIMTLVRDRAGSVWAAGILHGTINAVAGLTILWLSRPDFPWNGLLGLGGYLALAIGVAIVFLIERRAPAPAALA